MILPDLNLLLYAYNPHVSQHERARAWWEECLRGDELIGLPHEIAFGFVRIATNLRLGPAAVPLENARAVVSGWLALPQARTLRPGPNHFEEVMDLMQQAQASGSILSDAILANHAIQNRAVLYSNDTDFARFKGLEWKNPLQG